MKKNLFILGMALGMILGIGFDLKAEELLAKNHVTEEELLFMEIPVVVTATRMEEPLNTSPAAMTVVTAKEIKNRGYRHLGDVLEYVPGFTRVANYNEWVGGMRGLYGSNNTKWLFLIDGHRLNTSSLAVFDFNSFFSLEGVERIEIMRSPDAAIYGGNSVLGIINIITKKPKDVDGLEINFGAGDNETQRHSLVYGRKLAQDGQVLLLGSYFHSKGDRINEPAKRDVSIIPVAGTVYVDRYEIPNYNLYFKLEEGDIILTFGSFHYDLVSPRSQGGALLNWGSDDPDDNRMGKITTFTDLVWNIAIDENNTLKVHPQLDWGEISLGILASPRRLGLTLIDAELQYLMYETDVIYQHNFSSNHILLVGADFRGEECRKADGYFTHPISGISNIDVIKTGLDRFWGIFVEDSWKPLKKLSLTTGVRYEDTKESGEGVSPRFGLVYSFSPETIAKLLYGKSFVVPGWMEKHMSFVYKGNPNLNLEIIEGWDLIFSNQFSKNFSGELGFFYDKSKNFIQADVSASSYVNKGELDVWGIESEGKLELYKGKLNSFLNYTYMEHIKDGTSSTLIRNDKLINIPTHSIKTGLTWRFSKNYMLTPLIRWYSVIETFNSNEPDGYEKLSDSAVVDLVFNVERLFNSPMRAKMSIYNLFDEDYYLGGGECPLPYRMPGRNFLVTVGYKF